jgi:glycerol kinase
MNTGNSICESKNGLLTTIAIGFGGKIDYAIEGSVFAGGAVVQWLRDELKIIKSSSETESIASSIEDNCGVYIVPAFTGLGAPHWDMYARGAIFGLTRGSGHRQLVRAALEAIAYQTKDVLDAITTDTGVSLNELKVDGGASANNFLMQFQSDIINKTIKRPIISETTALGAAYLAGLTVGFWKDLDEVKNHWTSDMVFSPKMTADARAKNIKGWNRALERAKNWEEV